MALKGQFERWCRAGNGVVRSGSTRQLPQVTPPNHGPAAGHRDSFARTLTPTAARWAVSTAFPNDQQPSHQQATPGYTLSTVPTPDMACSRGPLDPCQRAVNAATGGRSSEGA